MRRRFLILGAAGLALVFAATAVLLWIATAPGFLETERVTDDPGRAAAIAAADLGLAALPAGIEALAAREGGFQDRFVQVRLAATDDGFAALLAALALTRADLVPAPAPYFGPADPKAPAGWDSAEGPSHTVELPSPRLDHLSLIAQPEPDSPERWRLYLWGFET